MLRDRIRNIIFSRTSSAFHRYKGQSIGFLIWLLVLFIFALIINDVVGLYNPSIGQIVPAGLGAIGTLLLAWVTLKSLEQNKELLKHQELEFTPSVRRVGDFDEDEDKDNYVKMELENKGYGKAMKIRLKEEIYVLNWSEDSDMSHISLYEYIKGSDDIDVPPIKGSYSSFYRFDQNVDAHTGDGGILESGEKDTFSSRIAFFNTNGHPLVIETEGKYPRIIVFDRLIEGLKGCGIPKLGLKFVLKYEDVLGNEYESEIPGPVFDIDETETLSDALNNPTWVADIPYKVPEGRDSKSE